MTVEQRRLWSLLAAWDSRDLLSVWLHLRRSGAPPPAKITKSELAGVTTEELWQQGRLALDRGRVDSLAWFAEAIAVKRR